MAVPQSTLEERVKPNYHYSPSLSTSELFDAHIISGHFFCRNESIDSQYVCWKHHYSNSSDRLSNKIRSDVVGGNGHN